MRRSDASISTVSTSQGTHPLESLCGRVVILDTPGPLIYIGTLKSVHVDVLVLEEADVHDTNDSRSTKDYYISQTRDLGVRANRSMVMVHRGYVISVSLLEDVLT
ncbi:MAG TPA: hypothetical protein VMG59_07025 [Phycisphaerae bacterium]|nr:hypothetical protein [Phycisphaerae bacterium]